MRQERFTEQAQEVLAMSQELVRQYQHSQWDVEHILLALLQQERGLVRDIFQELGADIETVRSKTEAALLLTVVNAPYSSSPSMYTEGYSCSCSNASITVAPWLFRSTINSAPP